MVPLSTSCCAVRLAMPRRPSLRAVSLLAGGLIALNFLEGHSATANTIDGFRDWKALRDAGVVRQERDFSCGLAALATLLTHYFDQPASESDLLARLGLPDADVLTATRPAGDSAPAERARRQRLQERGVSLALLAALARQYGLRAQGVSIRPEALSRLSVPAIAYIEPEGEPHFTLIRGVDRHGNIQVADPSWGNRLFSAADFARVFSLNGSTAGRLLLVMPAGEAAVLSDWFAVDRAQPLIQRPHLGR
ncbi:hypothetical protein EV688_101182 [Chromatocurvus halotolerans]|uniref:Peptidase C39 domain-containing protein n=2 Tax=Chromatocurvus halotolerans TaxID=1132028 RepID=A0A4R2L3I3_9GAMM|nr:hypothetical protein EV688_101182 [Chromatocurvus halotolerans]